jgi:glycosyltransferase involved in cell wall biosynthesis
MSRKILFIAYSYPPVGGGGLPGVQRIVKFVRHLDFNKAYILTVNPDYYPDYVVLDNKLELPINSETVIGTKAIDIFKIMISIKKLFLYFRKHNTNVNQNSSSSTSMDHCDSNDTCSDAWYKKNNRSRIESFKDFVYNIFYFPDDASPWILPAIFGGLKIIKRHKITVLFATGMPWTSLLVAYVLSRLTGVPLVVDFRDPWIGNPFHVSKGKLLDRLAIRLEKIIIKHARLVSANTEELRNAFVERYSYINPGKFTTLSNGYDVNDYEHLLQTKKLDDQKNTEQTLVLTHAGFLYGTRDPSPILEAIKIISKIKNSNVKIIFCQIGKISLNYNFYEEFKDLLVEKRIILVNQLPYKECLEKLLQADVLLNIQPKTMTQIPSKIYDYLCLKLPILTISPLDGALGRMVKHYSLGDIFDPEDIDGISSYILEQSEEKQKKGRISVNYKNRELFDVRKIANSLSQSLRNIGV